MIKDVVIDPETIIAFGFIMLIAIVVFGLLIKKIVYAEVKEQNELAKKYYEQESKKGGN